MVDDNDSLPIWPAKESQRAKLLTPSEWKGSDVMCLLQYHAEERLLHVVSESGTVLDTMDMDDIIGVNLELVVSSNSSATTTAAVPGRASNEPPSNQLVDRNGSAVLTLYCYPKQSTKASSLVAKIGLSSSSSSTARQPNYQRLSIPKRVPRTAAHRRFVVAPSEDLNDISKVAAVLQHYATGRDPSRKLRYLILVNPKSGPQKNGQQVAETIVQPMLQQSGIDSDIIVTSYAGHATDIGKVQTVPLEDDNNKSLRDDYQAVLLLGGDGIVHEFLNGVAGHAEGLDGLLQSLTLGVIGCGTANGFAKTVTYASYEAVGPRQETFLVCKGDVHAADLSQYTTATQKTYTSFLTFSWAMIADIDIESECLHCLGELRFDLWAVRCVAQMRTYRGRLSYTTEPDPTIPASVNDPLPSTWTVLEEDFVLLWASHVSHAAMSSHHSPRSRLQDGIFQILIVKRPCSRYRTARILLGLEDASHENMPGAEFIACTAYRLEPQGSFNDLDGEVIEGGPIQAKVLPSAMKVFANLKLVNAASTTHN